MADNKVEHTYSDDQKTCLVARRKCGHYVSACVLDVPDLGLAVESAKEWRARGATLEIRPVSFVRTGGLTFDCKCEAAISKAEGTKP